MSAVSEFHAAAAAPARPARALRALGWLLAAALLFALGQGLGSGRLLEGARGVFEAIAQAQYRNYLAGSNLDATGNEEFLLWLRDDDGADAARRFVAAREGWSLRESALPGWLVVVVPEGVIGARKALAEAGFARTVLENRGLWFCH